MMRGMQKEYRSLRRRPFLAPVWIFALAALLALAAAAWAVYAASTTLIVVTRHAEKAVGAGDDPPLSPDGLARAERLAASNTVPEIVRRLADGAAVPPIADDEYGTAYVVAVPRWSRPAVLRLQLP